MVSCGNENINKEVTLTAWYCEFLGFDDNLTPIFEKTYHMWKFENSFEKGYVFTEEKIQSLSHTYYMMTPPWVKGGINDNWIGFKVFNSLSDIEYIEFKAGYKIEEDTTIYYALYDLYEE